MMTIHPSKLTGLFVFIFALLIYTDFSASQAPPPPMPDKKFYPNSFELMVERDIEGYEGYDWVVFANKKGVTLTNDVGRTVSKAKFLEPFKVVDRRFEERKVKVVPFPDGGAGGWVDMCDLILHDQAIRSSIRVPHKIFLKVKLREATDAAEGVDLLRFRNGPGEGGGKQYDYLIKREEVNRVGSIFLYLYGVHFQTNDDLQRYLDLLDRCRRDKLPECMDLDLFKGADYYLVGAPLSVSTENIKNDNAIRGWLPKEAAVLWHTRQALETTETKGRMPEAHRFNKRPDLLEYFGIPDSQGRSEFIKKLVEEDKAERDDGSRTKKSGQELRYLVLENNERKGIASAYVGYSGAGYSVGKEEKAEKENVAKAHETMAKWQSGSKYVDLFFLIDGTKSMGDALVDVSNVVEGALDNLKKDPSFQLNYHAAVYRDRSEGKQQYVEWDRQTQPDLAKWLRAVKPISDPLDDFSEALFESIDKTLQNWSFSHEFSTRILFILADAGDDDDNKPIDKKISDTVKLLKEKCVLPLVLHFNHPLDKIDPNKIGAICDLKDIRPVMFRSREEFDAYTQSKEYKAMCEFKSQMRKVNESMYARAPNMHPVPTLEEGALEKKLENYVQNVVLKTSWMIEELKKIRQGQKSVLDIYQEFEHASESSESSAFTGGLFQAQFEMLRERHPELAEVLEKQPELAFLNAYMPVKDKNHRIMRPVLFISAAEIGRILTHIQTLHNEHRTCTPDAPSMTLKVSMLSVLGDLLQIPPNLVTDEQLDDWFDIILKGDASFVGAPDILKELCKNRDNWDHFLNKLKMAERYLIEIEKKRPEDITYIDLNDARYYWIYPEDIFPSLKSEKNPGGGE